VELALRDDPTSATTRDLRDDPRPPSCPAPRP